MSDVDAYKDYMLVQRYTDGQRFSWCFVHREYDGPPDRRIGYAKTREAACREVDEQIAGREEMECAG